MCCKRPLCCVAVHKECTVSDDPVRAYETEKVEAGIAGAVGGLRSYGVDGDGPCGTCTDTSAAAGGSCTLNSNELLCTWTTRFINEFKIMYVG